MRALSSLALQLGMNCWTNKEFCKNPLSFVPSNSCHLTERCLEPGKGGRSAKPKHAHRRIGGSNPPLSAKFFDANLYGTFLCIFLGLFQYGLFTTWTNSRFSVRTFAWNPLMFTTPAVAGAGAGRAHFGHGSPPGEGFPHLPHTGTLCG